MPGGHTETVKPNLTACPAFQAAISGPKAGNAQPHANMAPISNEHKSVQGLYEDKLLCRSDLLWLFTKKLLNLSYSTIHSHEKIYSTTIVSIYLHPFLLPDIYIRYGQETDLMDF